MLPDSISVFCFQGDFMKFKKNIFIFFTLLVSLSFTNHSFAQQKFVRGQGLGKDKKEAMVSAKRSAWNNYKAEIDGDYVKFQMEDGIVGTEPFLSFIMVAHAIELKKLSLHYSVVQIQYLNQIK